ncbi:hypothetical protein [Pseudoduganella namucuonensis]|uniref:hypothetical protein n=1 Tax=Pseudoduganella namucuonensis TaxID=1035707 RepID=UPI0015A6CF93|nr:hypothetical protein [Pseudoduganella namucuonensis]
MKKIAPAVGYLCVNGGYPPPLAGALRHRQRRLGFAVNPRRFDQGGPTVAPVDNTKSGHRP